MEPTKPLTKDLMPESEFDAAYVRFPGKIDVPTLAPQYQLTTSAAYKRIFRNGLAQQRKEFLKGTGEPDRDAMRKNMGRVYVKLGKAWEQTYNHIDALLNQPTPLTQMKALDIFTLAKALEVVSRNVKVLSVDSDTMSTRYQSLYAHLGSDQQDAS